MTTNYERIKNMTVDEMVEFILKRPFTYITCNNCIGTKSEVECKERFCKGHIKQWLQQESE